LWRKKESAPVTPGHEESKIHVERNYRLAVARRVRRTSAICENLYASAAKPIRTVTIDLAAVQYDRFTSQKIAKTHTRLMHTNNPVKNRISF
jgi:hypothetical protein